MTCDSMAEAPALSKCSLQRQPLSFRDCSHRGAALRHIAWQASARGLELAFVFLHVGYVSRFSQLNLEISFTKNSGLKAKAFFLIF